MPSLIEQVLVAASFEGLAALLVEWSLKATLLLGIVWIAMAACRRASAALRHAIWAGGTSAVLVLPVVSYCLPGWNILTVGDGRYRSFEQQGSLYTSAEPTARRFKPSHSTSEPAPPAVEVAVAKAVEDSRGVSQISAAGTVGPPISADQPAAGISIVAARRWCISAWIAVASLLVVRLFASWAYLRRLLRRSARVTGGRMFGELTAARQALRIRRRVGFFVAPCATSPLATGILRPCIILPAASRNWSRGQLRSVLVHELAHIRRHDCLTQLIAGLASVLQWFNPLVWVASRRMQIERESACDDVVLAYGVAPLRYVEQLFSVATGLDYHRVLRATSLAMAKQSRLESRLASIVSANRRRQTVDARQWFAIVVVLLIITASIAMLRPQLGHATELPKHARSENAGTRVTFEPSDPVDLYGDPLPRGAFARLGTSRLRLTGVDKSVVFAADNRTLFTATAEGDHRPIYGWDAPTGELLREIPTAPFPPRYLRVSPDGRTLVAYGLDYPARELPAVHVLQIWDLPSDKLRSIVPLNVERGIRGQEIAPDGKSLIMADGSDIRVLDLDSGEEILRYHFGERDITALAVAADGEQLAVATGDGLFLWNWVGGERPERLAGVRRITSLAFSPDSTSLASAGRSHEEVNIWDVPKKQVRRRLVDDESRNSMNILQLVFAKNGGVLLAANARNTTGYDPGVLMWDATTGELIRRFTLGGVEPWTLAVSRDDRLLAAYGDSVCGVWELDSGEELSGNLVGHREPISSVAFAKGDSQVVTADYGGSVRLWDAASGKQIRTWDHRGQRRPAVCVSPDQRWVASSAHDVRVWNAETGEEKYRFDGHDQTSRRALAFTPDNRRLVSWSGGDQILRIWDMETGKAITEYDVDPLADRGGGNLLAEDDLESDGEAFSLSGDGRRLCVTIGATLYVFDALTGRKQRELSVIGRPNWREIRLSPDGTKLLVSGAKDSQIRDQLTAQLIDVVSGEVQWEKKLPQGTCGPTGFSPDGTLVAATVRDQSGAILVWDVVTGTEHVRIEGVPEVAWGSGRGRNLAISADNTRLAVAMMNTTTLIWDISQSK